MQAKIERRTKLLVMLFVMVAAVMTLTPAVMAFAPPVAGAVGFDLYDIGFTKFLQGAIGYLVAAGLATYALVWQLPQKDGTGALYSMGSAAGFGTLQGILTSFGAII